MFQNYDQDAMTIVRKYGKPDVFLTMTANPWWPEIIENSHPNQKANDRPDIVSRVFEPQTQRATQRSSGTTCIGPFQGLCLYNRVPETWSTTCAHAIISS